MFRLRALYPYPLRVFHCGAVRRDQVLAQLLTCTSEEHVFSVVGKNKAELTVDHVGCAIRMLCMAQQSGSVIMRQREQLKRNSKFLALLSLAESKISLMQDSTLVEMFYCLFRLQVDYHDSLVQQLTVEGWNRLERFSMPRLARFSERLSEQSLKKSPLMGQIAEIVNQRLDSIEDFNVLTTFMASICNLVSPRFRDALIEKADVLLDSMDPFSYKSLIYVLYFFRVTKYTHRPLLEKCSHIFLQNIPCMEAEDIHAMLHMLRKFEHFRNSSFALAAKQRLMELRDTSNNFLDLTNFLFFGGPLAGQAFRERLESAALLVADELNARHALTVAETLVTIKCRNVPLINKIASVLQKNLEVYEPLQIAKITQLLIFLCYDNPELFSRLKSKLRLFLQYSVSPSEVSKLTQALIMLHSPCMDEEVISRIYAVLPQARLYSLNCFTLDITKLINTEPTYHYNTPSKYIPLLQTVNRCGRELLQKADRLDLMLMELQNISMKWFEETLLEDTIAMLQRLVDQVSWRNVPDLALFLKRRNIRCTPVLDRIANVAMENIHKIHYSATNDILGPFAFLNYNSPRVDELFDTCVQHFTPHISSMDRFLLVKMAYTMAVANSFPEEVIREIFSVDFLAKLEAQLKSLPRATNMVAYMTLMKLNRAVCLDCPQFQVPWFHEHFCRKLQRKDLILVSPVQKQIQKMLGEVLGGINRARAAVLTPYFYTVDFECVLDHHNQAVPYSELSHLQKTEDRKVDWDSGSPDKKRKELLPGSRRIALDVLDSKSYCNCTHVKGEVLMRKRHLENLGYHVLQIPHFEWNSMELYSEDARKKYLRKKLFSEQASDTGYLCQ